MMYEEKTVSAKPFKPDDIPFVFRTMYNPLIAGIKRKGGEPNLNTLRIIVDNRENGYSTLVVRVDARFGKKSVLEELNDVI